MAKRKRDLLPTGDLGRPADEIEFALWHCPEGNNVRSFPSHVHRDHVRGLARRIARGRDGTTVRLCLEERAMELAMDQVEKSAARRDLAGLERELRRAIAEEVHAAGGRHDEAG